jgi:hypothetical protein
MQGGAGRLDIGAGKTGPDDPGNAAALAEARRRVQEADTAARAAREEHLQLQDDGSRDRMLAARRDLEAAEAAVDALRPASMSIDDLIGPVSAPRAERETYTIRYVVTPSAVSDAIRLQQQSLIARFRIVSIAITVVGALLVVVGIQYGLTIAIVGAVLLASTWMQFVDRWLYKVRGRGVIGNAVEYVVDDSGIRYQTALGSGVLNWPALTRVLANDKSIVLARDRVIAAYVPTNAFGSPAERDAFLAFARAHVSSPAAGV